MKKMRILFEAGPLVDSRKTGVGYYLNHMVSSLGTHHGPDLSLEGYYFDFLNRKRKRAPEFAGVRFRKIWFTPGKLLSLCRRLGFQPYLDCFTSTKADLVFYTNYVALPTLRRRQVMALAVYDLSFLDCPQFTQSVNLRFMQRFCSPSIRRADIIVTISAFTKERLLHHFPDLTADVIVTPIPPIATPDTRRPQLGARLEELGIATGKYVLYLGTIEPRKNIQALVKAYALLPAEVRQAYALVLAGGKGWKDEAILAEIRDKQAVGMNIIQTGYIAEEEKAALYSHAACFVLPSHYEGFGMPVLEAMQCGLPITLSDIPVFREVAGEAAVYFDKDSESDIAAKLERLLTDKAQRLLVTGHAPSQLQKFSWADNAELLYDAFRKRQP